MITHARPATPSSVENDQVHRYATTTRHRGFTLIELLLSIGIIAILIGLLLVGIRQATRSARNAAGKQDMSSLNMAIQTFRNDFGFLPPLVKDGHPGTPYSNEDPLIRIGSGRNARLAPNAFDLTDADDLEFLQDDTEDADYRYSEYSLAYYIMGALGKEADFVEGPGAHPPMPNGVFEQLTNKTYDPLFAPKTGGVTQTDADPDAGRIVLQDGNGNAYRYYRWEHATAGTSGYDANNPLRNLRLPKILGSAQLSLDPNYTPAADNIELRDAGYAIVAAGNDGVFGDLPIESLTSLEEAFGQSFRSDEEAEDKARADNIVEVGR